MHDLTNKNSYSKLKKWIEEVLAKVNRNFTSLKWKTSVSELDEESGGSDLLELEVEDGFLPVLIIGNKSDLVEKEHSKEINLEETGRSSLNVVLLLSFFCV